MFKKTFSRKNLALLSIIMIALTVFNFTYAKTDLEKLTDKSNKIYLMVSRPSMDVYGTNYFLGEINATTFLQLLNATSKPITNATCFTSIWYPDNSIFFNNTVMNYLNEGLYYKKYNLPQTEGVYIISAKCYTPKLKENITGILDIAYDDFECNDWNCHSNLWETKWTQRGDVSDSIRTDSAYNGTYGVRLRGTDDEDSSTGEIYREVDLSSIMTDFEITFWAKADSLESSDYAYFKINDGTEHTLETWGDGDDDNTWRFYNFSLNDYNKITDFEIIFEFVGESLDYFYIDTINITGREVEYIWANDTLYQEVRGSGEVHVINPISTIINGTSILDEILWQFQFDRDNTLVSNHNYCIDNQTLRKTLTYEYCIGSNCRTIQKNETIPCDYGCQNDQCVNPTFNWITLGIFTALLLAVAFFYSRTETVL
jgi:hypothetical protein